MDQAPKQLSISDALDLYFKRLGLSPDAADALRSGLPIESEGLVWLSDHPLMVYRIGSELVVDSEELNKLLAEVGPIKFSDEGNK